MNYRYTVEMIRISMMTPGSSEKKENMFLFSIMIWGGKVMGRKKERGCREKHSQLKRQNTRPNFSQRIYNDLVYESSASKSEPIFFILESSSTSLKQNCDIGTIATCNNLFTSCSASKAPSPSLHMCYVARLPNPTSWPAQFFYSFVSFSLQK